MKVWWTSKAEQDRADIMVHIAADTIAASVSMDELFGSAALQLGDFPGLGQPGQVAGTRELVVHESYRPIYELAAVDQAVWILALIHTARQWPPLR